MNRANEPVGGDHPRTRLREHHARFGVILSLASILVLVGYALLGHPDANRGMLLAVAAGSTAGSSAMWILGPIAARHRLHATYFFAWSAALVTLILVVTYLDGGETSPLAAFLFLPMLYSVLDYPPRTVVALGVVAVAGQALIAFNDPTLDVAHAVVTTTVLGLAAIAATQSARNRDLQAQEVRALTSQLELLATHDALTGCFNRLGFDRAIEREVSRALRYDRPLSLLLLDVDHLKRINDENGHARGDAALRLVASVLLHASRRDDIAARLGGDEFALLMPETGPANALDRADRIHAALRAAGCSPPVTLSIGAASVGPGVTTPDELLHTADQVLYAAKQAGRNRTAALDDAQLGTP
jgi:diguanylate cyclase (GGDEF)-like protein